MSLDGSGTFALHPLPARARSLLMWLFAPGRSWLTDATAAKAYDANQCRRFGSISKMGSQNRTPKEREAVNTSPGMPTKRGGRIWMNSI